MRVILFYDIDTTEKEGQRRLQRALKIARKYLNHVQKSVFGRCQLLAFIGWAG